MASSGPPPTVLSPDRPGNQSSNKGSGLTGTVNSKAGASYVPARDGGFADTDTSWGNPSNPSFDARSLRAGVQARGGVLFRGRITQLTAYDGAPFKYSLNFLWNPGAITAVFGFDENRSYYGGQDNNSVPNLMTGMNVSFQLLFVRQYESMSDPNNRGTLVDIGQLERMLATPPGQADTNAGSGILTSVPVVVTFGSTPDGKRWEFTGTITGCSVQYLMFNRYMIPTITQCDLTLTRRFFDQNASTSSNGASK